MKSANHENIIPEPARESSGRINTDDSVSSFSESSPNLVSASFASISEMKSSSHGFSRLLRAKFHGKWVVLKTLKPQYAYNAELQSLLKKEFEIGYSLNHPNIAQTLDFVDVPGYGNCIVMEWVDGSSLRQLINDRHLDVDSAIELLKDVVHALDYIHQHQIVHRDVKPSNIMVTSIGNVPKIIDFGLSDGSAFHILKQPAGTPRYMSPEAHDPGNIDERIDMFSVGIIAGELNSSLTKKSKVLQRVARQCANPNPDCRPRNYNEIHWKSKTVRQKWMWTVIAVAISALAFAILLLPNKDGVSVSEGVKNGRDKEMGTDKTEIVNKEKEISGFPGERSDGIESDKYKEADKNITAEDSAAKERFINEQKLKIQQIRQAQEDIRRAIGEIGEQELEKTYQSALKIREKKGTALTLEEITPLMNDNYDRLEQEGRKYFEENRELFEIAGYDWAETVQIIEMVKGTSSPQDQNKWTRIFR